MKKAIMFFVLVVVAFVAYSAAMVEGASLPTDLIIIQPDPSLPCAWSSGIWDSVPQAVGRVSLAVTRVNEGNINGFYATQGGLEEITGVIKSPDKITIELRSGATLNLFLNSQDKVKYTYIKSGMSPYDGILWRRK